MIRTGKVVRIEENTPVVCFDRLASCDTCTGCSGEQRQTSVRVLGEAKEGDEVEVLMPDYRILSLSFVMYAIPMIGLVLGIVLGNALSDNQLVSLGIGVACMAAIFVGISVFDHWLQKQEKWQPRIISVHDKKTE